MLTTEPPPRPSSPAAPPPTLSSDLPLFCEGCGYSLLNLPQKRCDCCAILHYHCPECGHRQPLNTLRPAFHRMLARFRFGYQAFSVFFRLNYFGWCLFGWFVAGYETSRTFEIQLGPNRYGGSNDAVEETIASSLFAFLFCAIGRMFLLRWRKGAFVGLWLAGLVVTAMLLGNAFRHATATWYTPGPMRAEYYLFLAWVILSAWTGAFVAWPIWAGLVRVFLPARYSIPFLTWQRSLSDPRHPTYEPTVFTPTPPAA